jgi:hypothetical protein
MGMVNGKWLIHPESGVHRVPDNPVVLTWFETRGWVVTDLPGELDSDDPDFIELLEKYQAKAKSATKPKKEAE